MSETYWIVTATDAQGNICYEEVHVYEQKAINDYNIIKRIFTDCTVEIEEWEES